MDANRMLRSLTSRQFGLVSRSQLQERQISQRWIDNEIARGRLEGLEPGVYRLAGSHADANQRALAALLAGRGTSALSHSSASALWQVPGYRFEPVHVTRLRDTAHSGATSATTHHPRLFLAEHLTELDGLPVLRPAPTCWSLATDGATMPRLERVIDNFLARRLMTTGQLADSVREFAGRGRRGSPIMRGLSAERTKHYVPPESGLERRFVELLRHDLQEPMRRQVNLGDAETWIARVDFLDDAAMVIVQINSTRFHTALVDRAKDRAQRQALEAVGYLVLEYDEFDVWYRPGPMLAEVRRHRIARRHRWSA